MGDRWIAVVRGAVRDCLSDLDPGDLVLVACSGGADSLALSTAAAWAGHRSGVRIGAVVVDHRLHPTSEAVAAAAARQCRGLGLDPVDVVAVDVDATGAGLEADARRARYEALDAAAALHDARAVLLGHTGDDQAEQVLLGLLRGSGIRSLAGMPRTRGLFRRPLLSVSRTETEAVCAGAGLVPWRDPHNTDRRFLRVRVRDAILRLEGELGPGLVAGLLRTADLSRADADHLDAEAAAAFRELGHAPWRVDAFTALPAAIRGRVWRVGLVVAGSPAGELGARHTDACDRLLTHWHGQGPVQVPGALSVSREAGSIIVRPTSPVE